MKTHLRAKVGLSNLTLLAAVIGFSACGNTSLHGPRSDGSTSDASGLADSEWTATGGVLGPGGATGTGGVTGGATGTDGVAGGATGTGGTTGTGGVPFSGCSIADSQYESGGVNPTNPCQICNPQASTSAWSSRDGVACDDGVYCNGTDACNGGTCSRHAGAPCLDDGVFCNGVETCDEANHRCVSSGNPCPDDGNLCGGPESCSESTKQCQRNGLANDCGTWVCGPSPSACFTCGTCGANQVCSQGQCGCEPKTATASAASPPPIPSGLKVVCLVDPQQLDFAAYCPIITCGDLTYWAFSPIDNTWSMTLVGYDATKTAVYQNTLIGARYLYQIEVDHTAQTVTLVGQSSQRIVVPWAALWQ